jgi:hypothetical protein
MKECGLGQLGHSDLGDLVSVHEFVYGPKRRLVRCSDMSTIG